MKPSREQLNAALKLEDDVEARLAARQLMAGHWGDVEVRQTFSAALRHWGRASTAVAGAELYRAAATMGALGRLNALELDQLCHASSKFGVSFLPALPPALIVEFLPALGTFHYRHDSSVLAGAIGVILDQSQVAEWLTSRNPISREFGALLADIADDGMRVLLAAALAAEVEIEVAAVLVKRMAQKHPHLVRAALALCPVGADVVKHDAVRGISASAWVPTSLSRTAWHDRAWGPEFEELLERWEHYSRYYLDDDRMEWRRWREAGRFSGLRVPPLLLFGTGQVPFGPGGGRRVGPQAHPFSVACFASEAVVGAVEAATGLTVTGPVWIEHNWALRYQYLDAVLPPKSRRALGELLGNLDWERAVAQEAKADDFRADVANARRRIVTEVVGERRGDRRGRDVDVRELFRSPLGFSSRGGSSGFAEAGADVDIVLAQLLPELLPWEVADVARRGAGEELVAAWTRYQNIMFGEGGIGRPGLNSRRDGATSLPDLEWFARIGQALPDDMPMDAEGLLGTYHPADGRVTLYSGMILAASRRFGWEPAEATLVALVHEVAHAALVKGIDYEGRPWTTWSRAPYDVHETLALETMRRALRGLGDEAGLRVAEAITSNLAKHGVQAPMIGLPDHIVRGAIARARRGEYDVGRPELLGSLDPPANAGAVDGLSRALADLLPGLHEDVLIAAYFRMLAGGGEALDEQRALELNLSRMRRMVAAGSTPPVPPTVGQCLEPVFRDRPELMAVVRRMVEDHSARGFAGGGRELVAMFQQK